MAKTIIANYTTLTAMPDNVTLAERIKLDSGSFTQVFDTSTNSVSAANAWNENTGPMFHVETKDTAGNDYSTTQSKFVIVYNDTEIDVATAFGTDGYLTNATAGIQARGLKKTVDSDGITHFQFVKDVFSGNNADSDTFYMKFDVKVNDTTMHEQTGEQPVVIIPVSKQGNTYYAVCSSTDITTSADGEARCKLFSTQDPSTAIDISQTSKWSIQWYKVVGTSSTALSDGSAKTAAAKITAADVAGVGLFRADITDLSTKKVYSGYTNVMDLSDPFRIGYLEEGRAEDGWSGAITHIPKMVQSHEIVKFTGQVLNSDGTVKENSGVTVKMTVTNKKGEEVSDYSGKTSFEVSHADIMKESIGGQLGIYLTGSTATN